MGNWKHRRRATTAAEKGVPINPGDNRDAILQKITAAEQAQNQQKTDAATEKTHGDMLDRATTIRKEFRDSKVFKDYEVISRSNENIEAAYKRATDPKTTSKLAADQALVTSFNKMLDPMSVVRESEYARTPEGASLINRALGYMKQIDTGGVGLVDRDRKEIYQMAQDLLSGSATSLKKETAVYKNIAKSFDIPEELIFGGMEKEFDLVGGSSNDEPPAKQEDVTLDNLFK